MCRAGWISLGGGTDKIESLRSRARLDDGVAAACLMELFGYREPDGSDPAARGYVGAIIVMDLARELTLIRKIIVKALSKD